MNNNIFNFLGEEDETPSFEDMRINNGLREISNGIALESPLGRQSIFYETKGLNKITDKIDFVKLAGFIKSNYNKIVDFSANKFIGYRTKTIETTVSSGIDAKHDRISGNVVKKKITFKVNNPIVNKTTDSERVLNLKANLSTKRDHIDLRIGKENVQFKLLLKTKKIKFSFKAYYSGSGRSAEEAIHIYTENYIDFDLLEKYISHSFITEDYKTEIENKFSSAFSNSKDDYSALSWLYEVAPRFVLEKRDKDDLYNDFIFILGEMSSTFSNSYGVDQNISILNILSGIDWNFIYKKLKSNQNLFFSILDKLDSDYDLLFVSIVTSICYDQWNNEDFKNRKTVKVGEAKEGNYYIYKVVPTIDLLGKINPKGRVNFQNVLKKGGSDNLVGIINIWPHSLAPLEPVYISPTYEKGIWVPAIALQPFLDKAQSREKIKFYTDILLVVATAGSIKILQSATAPTFLKIIAAVELAKAPVDVAMQSYVFRKALAKTEEGKWFVDNWQTISTTVDITTLGSDFLYTLYRNGPKIAAFFRKRKRKDAADGLDNLIKEVGEHLDDIGSLRFKGVEIKTKEELIKFLDNIDESYKAIYLDQVGIKILFRGTNKNLDNVVFPGNKSSQTKGMSTSTDPLRAIVFGIESATISGNKGILQLVLTRNLTDIKLSAPNRRVHYELEVVVKTDANNLSNLAVKEVPIEDARRLANDYFDLPEPIPSKIFDETRSRELMEEILPILDLKESIKFYEELIKL